MQHVESMVLDAIRKGLGTKCNGLSMDALIYDGGLVRGEVTPERALLQFEQPLRRPPLLLGHALESARLPTRVLLLRLGLQRGDLPLPSGRRLRLADALAELVQALAQRLVQLLLPHLAHALQPVDVLGQLGLRLRAPCTANTKVATPELASTPATW
jgi:hypothetical protein